MLLGGECRGGGGGGGGNRLDIAVGQATSDEEHSAPM